MKLKIKPSAKIKRRYLLIQASSKEDVEKTMLEYLGVLGWAKATPVFVQPLKKNLQQSYILSVDRKELSNIRAAFELSHDKIKIIRVSGTLKGLFREK